MQPRHSQVGTMVVDAYQSHLQSEGRVCGHAPAAVGKWCWLNGPARERLGTQRCAGAALIHWRGPSPRHCLIAGMVNLRGIIMRPLRPCSKNAKGECWLNSDQRSAGTEVASSYQLVYPSNGTSQLCLQRLQTKVVFIHFANHWLHPDVAVHQCTKTPSIFLAMITSRLVD